MTDFVPKRKRLLTRPVLKMPEGTPRYVRIEEPMFIGKTVKEKAKGDDNKKEKEPATILNVVDLSTGEQAQIVCNTVLKSVLSEEYPNNAYVGKCFLIEKQGRAPGKDYNPFHIEEIEDPAAATELPETTPAAHGGSKRK
jgi:hypothetical protein